MKDVLDSSCGLRYTDKILVLFCDLDKYITYPIVLLSDDARGEEGRDILPKISLPLMVDYRTKYSGRSYKNNHNRY